MWPWLLLYLISFQKVFRYLYEGRSLHLREQRNMEENGTDIDLGSNLSTV